MVDSETIKCFVEEAGNKTFLLPVKNLIVSNDGVIKGGRISGNFKIQALDNLILVKDGNCLLKDGMLIVNEAEIEVGSKFGSFKLFNFSVTKDGIINGLEGFGWEGPSTSELKLDLVVLKNGRLIVEKLRFAYENEIEILALGTNALAASLMLKAGANEGASGENAVIFNSCKVDIIMGTMGIVCANSMLGELTPAMAKAISESPAVKVLIPLSRCNIKVAGTKDEPLPHYIDDALNIVGKILRGGN
jgi:hypothetical protein